MLDLEFLSRFLLSIELPMGTGDMISLTKSSISICFLSLIDCFIAGRFKHASRDASSKAGTGGGSGGSGAKELVIEHRIPPRLEMLMDMPPVSKDIQIKHAWNSDDR